MAQELGLEYEWRPIASRSGETQTEEYLGKINPYVAAPSAGSGHRRATRTAAGR